MEFYSDIDPICLSLRSIKVPCKRWFVVALPLCGVSATVFDSLLDCSLYNLKSKLTNTGDCGNSQRHSGDLCSRDWPRSSPSHNVHFAFHLSYYIKLSPKSYSLQVDNLSSRG